MGFIWAPAFAEETGKDANGHGCIAESHRPAQDVSQRFRIMQASRLARERNRLAPRSPGEGYRPVATSS